MKTIKTITLTGEEEAILRDFYETLIDLNCDAVDIGLALENVASHDKYALENGIIIDYEEE